jgi:BirA family biotin operon repressor/biotin-[acetyl-CoA-carboxylase] ligase
LTFSVLLRPARPVARHGWIPLLAGLAVVEALAPETGVDLSLKWPNDVLAGGRKVAGLLAERAGGAVVVGIGVNVSQSQDQLPAAEATSLMLAGSRVSDRVQLLRAVLARLDARLAAWDVPADQTAAADAELAAAYRAACATLGRSVRAQLPGGRSVTGLAQDIDAQGRLQVMSADRLVAVAAGDVVHLR